MWEYREHPKNVARIRFQLALHPSAGVRGEGIQTPKLQFAAGLSLFVWESVCRAEVAIKRLLSLFPHCTASVWADTGSHMLTQICLAGSFSHPAGSSLAFIFLLKVSAWGNKGTKCDQGRESESSRERDAQSIYAKAIKLGIDCRVTYQGPLQFEQVSSRYYADSNRLPQPL